jgi:hypothetical protein
MADWQLITEEAGTTASRWGTYVYKQPDGSYTYDPRYGEEGYTGMVGSASDIIRNNSYIQPVYGNLYWVDPRRDFEAGTRTIPKKQSEGAAYLTGPDGKQYVYIPQEFVQKGSVVTRYDPASSDERDEEKQYFNKAYLDKEVFKNAYSFTAPDSLKLGDQFAGSKFSDPNKGFLFPADYYEQNIAPKAGSYTVAWTPKVGDDAGKRQTTGYEPIKGIGNVNERIASVNGMDASKPVYMMSAKQKGDNRASQTFISPDISEIATRGIVVNKNNGIFGGGVLGDIMGGIADLVHDLGPVGQIAMMYATAGLGSMVGAATGLGTIAGTALVNGGLQLARGAELDDVLTNAAKSVVIGNAAGQISNTVLGDAVVEQYGTNLGSEQTNMLAASEAGMGTLAAKDFLGTGIDVSADLLAKTAGQTVGSVLAGNDVMSALTTGGINVGVPMLTSQIPGFSELDPKLQRAASIVIGNELQGKDPSQALINQAIQIGMDTVKTVGKNLKTNYSSSLAAEGIDPDTFDAAELNQLTQDDLAKIVAGGIGDATLTGGTGQDTLAGGSLGDASDLAGGQDAGTGSNQLTEQDIVNIVNGGVGDATLTGGAKTDTIVGGQDSVVGGEATTQGGTGTDTIVGGAGTGTTIKDDDGNTLTVNPDGTTEVTQSTLPGGTGASDVIKQPNTEYFADGTYKVTYEDGTSAIFNADGTPYSTVDNTGTNNLSIILDDSSPSGYRDSLGQPVNQDGTPYVAPAGNDTLTGGQSTSTGGQSTVPGGQSTVPGGQSTVPGGQSTVPGGSGGLNLGALLALLGAGQGQQAPTAPPVVDIGEQLDLEEELQTSPFAKKKTQSKMAEGGSIDDLLALLQQRG